MLLEISCALVAVLSLAAILTRDLLKTAIILGASDLALAVAFYLLAAPDIAITQASVVTAFSTIILIMAVKKTGRNE